MPLAPEPRLILTRSVSDTNNGELRALLSAIIRRHGRPRQRTGVPFGTDAPHFAATGCPTVVFGPGSIDQAHTADEWLPLDQLQSAAEILYDFLQSPL